MTQDTFRKTILAVIYLLCIPVIVFTARLVSGRSLSVSETAFAGTNVPAGAFTVNLEPADASSCDLKIPLPSDVSQDDITFENRYAEHVLYITINTAQRSYYLDRTIAFNEAAVSDVSCLLQGDNTIGLLIRTEALSDPVFRLENNAIMITFQAPYESAEHVIILDPFYGGAGSDVALSLARRLQEALLASPLSCRVLLTRTGTENAADDAVTALIEESHASRYIRLDMPEGEAALSATVSLYDGFFIRDYGNVPFASDVMRALSAVTDLQSGGVHTASDDTRLKSIRIPAVSVHIEGVRSSFGDDEKLLAELASALSTALRLGFQSKD